MKVSLRKTKVMVSAGITKNGLSKSRVYPGEVCSLKVKADTVLSAHCGKWIHSRHAGVMIETPMFIRKFCLQET